jgi:hypothetical protein
VRRVDPDSPAADVLSWTIALALPAMSASFLLGLVRERLFAANALETFGPRLHAGLDAAGLRDALAAALDDPSLHVAYWVPVTGGRWVDADGRPVELPAPGSGQRVTEVLEGDRRIAAIVHDEALCDQQELVDAAGLCSDRPREPAPCREGGVVAARGARVARPDPGDRRRGAPAD